MLDKNDATIQIVIEENVIWVNVDGVCAVRIHNPIIIEIVEHGRDIFTFQKDIKAKL